MLFVESKTLSYQLSGPERIQFLEKLQQQGKTPIIRASRLNCFDRVLLGPERVRELEATMANNLASENSEPYIRGDLFSLNDHVLFIIFEGQQQELSGIQAGIVYDSRSSEPLRKLDVFCREVREVVRNGGVEEAEKIVPDWKQGKPLMPEGFKRFVANQDIDSMYTSLRKDTMAKRIVAAARLEDERAREFLRSTREAHIEGYATKLLTGETTGSCEFSIEKLEEAGLVEREVQVSCRKTGHALLRLPNAHALVVVTVSDATCSECGAAVADEKVEEVIAPTQLASSLLEDGAWLVNRLHFLLREMGVPESEIALGPSEGEGYGQMMANICGEPFLIVARDGDLTPSFARWAVDLEIETEASHLVVVATGTVHNQARVLLHNHARRRIVAGRDFELVLADGPAAAGRELLSAFARVSRRVIAEHLCDLDSTVGLNVTSLIMAKFDFLQSQEDLETRHHSSESPAAQSSHSLTRPLALAAGASTAIDGAIDVEFVSDDLSPGVDSTPAKDIESEMISDARASWE
jgi:hypothetical protein